MNDDLEKLSENLQIWLESEIKIKDSLNGEEEERKTTFIHRITELYIKNRGSLEIESYGTIEPADFANPYGAYGLSEDEAMELIGYSNAIWGYALALGTHDDDKWFNKNLWSKVKELHEKDLVIAKKNAIKYMEEHKNKSMDDIEKSPSDNQAEPENLTKDGEEPDIRGYGLPKDNES